MAELFDKYEKALRMGTKSSSEGGNVRIAGSGVISGGRYERISISGSGKVAGDVEAEEVKVSGSARFMGKVVSEIFECFGSCKINGDVKSKVLRVAGAVSVHGSVEGGEVKISGVLKAPSVKANVFHVAGSFRVNTVEAEEAIIKVSKEAEAGKIKAKRVTVTRSRGETLLSFEKILKYALQRKALPVLKVEEITSDSLVVEDVLIEGNVYAKEIVLKGGADILGSIQGEVKREK